MTSLDRSEGRGVRFFSAPLGLLVLAPLLAAALTIFSGRAPMKPPLFADTETKLHGPQGGNIRLIWDSTVGLDVPEEWRDKQLGITFDVKAKWIGQIFIYVDDNQGRTEAFLTGEDVHRSSDNYERLRLDVRHDAVAVGVNGAKPDHVVPRARSNLRQITIKSHQSHFHVDNLTVEDLDSGERLYSESFGESLTDRRHMLILTLALLVILLIVRWLEAYLIAATGLASPAAAMASFAASYLPMIAALLLTGLLVRSLAIPLMLIGGLLFRIGVLLAEAKGRPWDFLWFLLAIPTAMTAAVVFNGSNEAGAWRPYLIGTLLFCVVMALFWHFAAKYFWGASARIAALPLLFPALIAVGPLHPLDGNDWATLGSIALAMSVAGYFALLRVHGKEATASGPMMMAVLFLFLGASELAVRHAAYSKYWQQDNVGGEFETSETLFWVPKNLFVPTPDFHQRSDFKVEKLNFRSGPTSDEVPAGTYRIVIMGGSNVWGDRLDRLQDTWGYKLEKLLNARNDGTKYEVVNAGVKGYNLFQLMVLHTLYMKDLDYDLLILYINFNDAAAYNEFGPFTYRELWEAKTGGHWDRVESYMDKTGLNRRKPWVIRAQDALHHFKLYNGLRMKLIEERGRQVAVNADKTGMKRVNPVEDYVANLKRMYEMASSRGAKAMFTSEFVWSLPATDDTLEDSSGYLFTRAEKATAAELGIPFCDTHQRLASSTDNRTSLVFDWDTVHLNPHGTDVLSKAMLGCLEENGLLP
ncbi:MAG: hypothetical protein H6684_06410 [Deltaproteobacteria bacterium]|nr:hypothetical protein [Deltaproteobacteria bacterium]